VSTPTVTTGDAPLLNVVTPVYFDVASFLVLRDRVRDLAVGSDAHRGVHFFAVDDTGGRDADIDALRQLPDVTVIGLPFNLGHQRAIVAGLRSLRDRVEPSDLVVTMDSDGEDRPEDMAALLQPLVDDPSPSVVAIARRTARKERATFRMLYLGFRLLFRVLTGSEIRSGNYAAFRGAYLRTMLLHPSFDLCYSSSLITLNPSPSFVPCPRGDRYAGASHMDVERLLTHGVRMLMPFADRIAIRFLTLCALGAITTALLLVVLVVGQALDLVALSSRWAWALAAGVVVSCIGLVNFLVLFAGFAQSDALSFARIDLFEDRGAEGPDGPAA
jgi:hypothetical protein